LQAHRRAMAAGAGRAMAFSGHGERCFETAPIMQY
jgi:hypothetical protein